MYRQAIENLKQWKDSPHRKPLLVTGIRQCGKTYLLKKFGEEYFDDVAYFYFEGNNRLASIFATDFDAISLRRLIVRRRFKTQQHLFSCR